METNNIEYTNITADEAIENIKNTGKKLIAIYALSYCAGFIIGFFITNSINKKINNA